MLGASAVLLSRRGGGCAETATASGGDMVEQDTPAEGGIPTDKEQDIQLMLQQREPSVLKCYQDVLNDKHDRAFKGTVMVVLTIEPTGKASEVRIAGGTLSNKEVTDCVVEKLKDFDYPQIPNPGTTQYTYKFEPAY